MVSRTKGQKPSEEPIRVNAAVGTSSSDLNNPITVIRDLDRMISRGERIYVRNMTDEIEDGVLGNMVVTFREEGSGKPFPVTIPDVKFPICISDGVTPDSLRKSQDLRQIIQKGALELLSEEAAELELGDPTIRAEAEDFLRSGRLRRSKAAKGEFGIDLNKDFDKMSIENENVNARVIAVTAQLDSQEITAKSAIRQLKNLGGTMTEEDLGYLISKVSNDAVRAFVEKAAKGRV